MDYLEILSYVCANHREYRIARRQYSNQDIFNDLGYTLNKADDAELLPISKGYASKILNGTRRHDGVLEKLADASVRQAIEGSLNLEGLFDCKSGEEIDRLVAQFEAQNEDSDGENEPPRARLGMQRVPNDFQLFSLDELYVTEPLASEGERGCQRLLTQLLLRSGQKLVHWGAPPWAGASFVASSLMGKGDIRSTYRYCCILRPTNFDDPYLEQLERLVSHFGKNPDRSNFASSILSLLEDEKVLLILLDACYIPDQGSFASGRAVRRILDQSVSRQYSNSHASILTVGRSQFVQNLVGDTGASRLNDILRVQPKLRFPLFHDLFEFFRGLRGNTRPEEGGSRIKRGRWHYEAIADAEGRESWPGMIRLRAYFASNFRNFAYFDPMRGFEKLCDADVEIPLSIEMAQDDVIAYLRRASSKAQLSEVRSLRLCSTAKHWLTADALNVLRQPFFPKGEAGVRLPELTLEAFQRIVDQKHCPIGVVNRLREGTSQFSEQDEVFTLSLGVKAVVQAEWLESDPFDRAVAHWRIAERLWKLQDDKELLPREFPYIPHWGRSRIFILGECIRHLMATIDAVSSDPGQVSAIFDQNFFPAPPTSVLGGCDPNEVINFCYARIFQREINANRGFAPGRTAYQTGRALAKRHGAFEYAAELLQLVGDGRNFGKPNRYLQSEFVGSYRRECAFACLDIGELQRANDIFGELCDLNEKDGTLGIRSVEDQLNLALVATELDDIERAIELVDLAKSRFDRLRKENKYSSSDFSSLRRRIAARQAHIATVTRKSPDAISLSREALSNDTDPSRWDAELVQNYIRALGNVEEHRPEALKECLAAAFRSSGAGFQHEALGYRVLLGRIFRLRNEISIAEQVLDDAQHNILAYGCSERAYLELLYEAGRTLCSMSDDFKLVRAYSSYLRPCLVRARSRRYGRFVYLAERYSSFALKEMKEKIENSTPEAWSKVIEMALSDEIKHASKEKLGDEGFFEVDPLFGYYVSGSQNIIRKLLSVDGVEDELRFVDERRAT
ncbi:hypothetical protein [Primorskyibacter flagellatus]|uniref:Uncharacterized protein n=1 Tax=Primorskyibacter flagellatus TaxID=1387277 RepID=A0A1W2DVU4_9RHOB|nr:hypothetical protein [Primorskyibacter flagellatus]SMD01136.1 hypothetical protein SAMN06295998_11824 [Primorskyibacter flagellatus]